MTDREIMQQALDALTRIWEDGLENYPVAAHESVMDALRERLAQPEQVPVACQYAKDVAMPEYRCAGKCQYAQPEQEQWDAIPDAFNEWWDADYDDTGNPFRKDSPAYWAWSGWRAASKQPEQKPVVHTTGHCENHKQKGGCQLHNLKCGWPDCDRKPITTPPQRKPLTDEQLDKAGMKLAECMDYPWEHMPEEGKRKMCDHAKAIIKAAHGIKE